MNNDILRLLAATVVAPVLGVAFARTLPDRQLRRDVWRLIAAAGNLEFNSQDLICPNLV